MILGIDPIVSIEIQILLPRHSSARVLYYWASGYRRSDELRDDLGKWAYFLRHAESLQAELLNR